MKYKFGIMINCLLLCGCQTTTGINDAEAYKRAEKSNLSKYDAQVRSASVSHVKYDIRLILDGSDTFRGQSKIDFEYKKSGGGLTLDFSGAEITSLAVNNKECDFSYNKWFITLPSGCLVSGENTLEVAYSRLHDKSGDGFHRNVDSTDGKIYLYTDFEPFNGNKLFPMFDQPDLKASFTLTTDVPDDWQVVSNEKEASIQSIPGGKRWSFLPTPPLSTYVMGLHAGPYYVWTDNSGSIPLKLFSRQSVKDNVDSESWFSYTKKGISYFENYFSIDYPFSKYDQVLVPDYLWNAMETSSAVTFSEALYAKDLNGIERLSWVNVVMHELAHHWYGNLATMVWWDDLWLNESFATFLAHKAVISLDEFADEPVLYFHSKYEIGAYNQDAGPASHEISQKVIDTDAVFNSIDSITYGKGASSLKQLSHLIGDKNFRKGLSNYLNRFAFKNASREDFIKSFENVDHNQLDGWQDDWLLNKGTNSLKFSYECSNGKISKAEILQGGDKLIPLRKHKIQLALFAIERGKPTLSSTHDIIISGRKQKLDELKGQMCPVFGYPNNLDWTFAQVELDAKSIQFLSTNMVNINDPLLRSMLWQNIWENTLSGNISIDTFLLALQNNISKETQGGIFKLMSSYLSNAFFYLDLMKKDSTLEYDTWVSRFEKLALENMFLASNEKRKGTWLDIYISVARSTDSLEKLNEIYLGLKKHDKKYSFISEEKKWMILQKLSALGAKNVIKLINDESNGEEKSTNDSSIALSLYPDIDNINKWLIKIKDHGSGLDLPERINILKRILPSFQLELRNELAGSLLASIPVVTKNSKNAIFSRFYSKYTILNTCSVDNINSMKKVIENNNFEGNNFKVALEIGIYEENQCVIIKQKRCKKSIESSICNL